MAKKVLALLVSATMVAAMLAGCGASSAEPAAEAEEEAVEEEAEPAEEEAAEPEAEAEAEPEAEAEEEAAEEPAAGGDMSNVMVGMLLNTTSDDGGWCQAQWVGLEDAAAALGMSEDQIVHIDGVPEEPVGTTSAVEELIDQGCNVIIGGSTGYAPVLDELAPQYPDVQFCQVGVPLENVLTYHGRCYQSMYVLGYMMAKLSGEDRLGYVAGMSEASVRFSLNGFALGAKAYNPNVKISLQWADSWYDPAKEGECANILIADGIKYMGAGTTSNGAHQACEQAGAFVTAYDVDHKDFAPSAVTASMVWNWAPIFEEILTNFVDGGMVPYVDNYFWGAEHGVSSIAYNEDVVDADTIAEMKDLEAKLAAGEIDVFAGELKDNNGNVLVAEGETMADDVILDQSFLVENVIGTF